MLGDLITRSLVLLLGYVYPAFECFKTVEKNRADIEQLRFWCQYWIIVAVLTVFERIGDIFLSWVPMYGELKLAFIIYLWYPKTKGTNYVYETFLQPYISKHETEIDRKLMEVRARAWDMAILYWKNFATQGQMKFFELLHYLAKQSARPTATQSAEPVPQSPNSKTSVNCQKEPQMQKTTGQWQPPPTPPPIKIMREAPQTPKADHVVQTPITIRREVSQTPKADHVVVQPPPAEATTARVEVGIETGGTPIASAANDQIQDIAMDETLRAARVRLRRANTSRIET